MGQKDDYDYRIDRGIRNTSRQISFEFLFIKTRLPDKLHNRFRRWIEWRNQIRYVIYRGASFDKKEFKRNLAGSVSYPPVYGRHIIFTKDTWRKIQSREKIRNNNYDKIILTWITRFLLFVNGFLSVIPPKKKISDFRPTTYNTVTRPTTQPPYRTQP
jgi:hypothetical protein